LKKFDPVKKLGPEAIRMRRDTDKLTSGMRARRVLPTSKPSARKIVALSCLHYPFQDKEMVERVVQEHHKDTDILVLCGDIMDQYRMSTFAKDKVVRLIYEHMEAERFVNDYLAKKFKNVVMIQGNHDVRLSNFLGKKVDPDIHYLIKKDILRTIADGERYNDAGELVEVKPRPNVHYNSGHEPWWTLIGKTVFCHPLTYKSMTLQTAEAAFAYFSDKRMCFDSVVVGHTHYQGKTIKSGIMLMETGCMALPMDYAKKGKLYYKNQQTGYGIIRQDADGNTLFNESQFVYMGTTVEHKDDAWKSISGTKVSKPRRSKVR
jgi:predicted phosphodiesterase